MLDAEYLDVLADPILELYEKFHISMIEEIARRLEGQTYATMAYQMQRLIESGKLYDEVLEELSKITGVTNAILNEIFQEAGVRAIKFDDSIYKAVGLRPLPMNQSPAMVQILKLGLIRTNLEFKNLTLTTALSAQQLYMDSADLAYMQITTGALSYEEALRAAVKDAARQGLYVSYPSGHKDKIDVALRRTVMTGVNQTAGELSMTRADEMETDLLQTSAHLGARNRGTVPHNHEMWQGRVYTRGINPANKGKYPDFYEITGYGTVEGLCGINCRHSFFPFFDGISQNAYNQTILDEYKNATVTYNGQEIDYYQATQMQRRMEREIRAAKRELAAVEAAKLDSSEEKRTLRSLQAKLRSFVNQTGLVRQFAREQIGD